MKPISDMTTEELKDAAKMENQLIAGMNAERARCTHAVIWVGFAALSLVWIVDSPHYSLRMLYMVWGICLGALIFLRPKPHLPLDAWDPDYASKARAILTTIEGARNQEMRKRIDDAFSRLGR